jgi:hypothetical protein
LGEDEIKIMKIIIFVSGSIKQGLDSPNPGESRWACNLAKMLSLNGHEVDCICNSPWDPPSWGSARVYPNVTLSAHIQKQKEYDLALYIPWDHQNNNGHLFPWESCKTLPVKAKWYVHNTFSWGDSIATDHDCYNNNHVLAYPYIQEDHQFPKDKQQNPFPTFPLPIPIYHELASINIENRKNILWSTKDVFHPDWGDLNHHVPRIGFATLKAIKRLSEKYDFEVNFLSTRFFYSQRSWIARDLGVPALVNSISNAYVHDLVPQSQLFDIMRTSRITAIVSGLLGSFGDSIAMGSVPMCYSGHIYREPADKHGLKLDTFNATEEEIYSCMERLYCDDDFYSKVIEDYRYEMRHYSYSAAYEYFKAMVNQLGIGDRL